ncbi:serine/threonine protein kinase [Streptomyces sp. F63]|uniref:serine/threonine-protein kinase n=1 Tax=Streptomyces sp. F63 TaxID=2824887 RepID=UPI001B39480F|nr:serine/threonine-protein kinase [Streptomyces sp. F63]MBQ0985870.1 serine/threonine protein kinase [Streptomyces sp. F63]
MSHGERIADRYELCTPIGHGAMGEGWDSTDLRLKRQVALKFIRTEILGADDERQRVIQRFRREAAAPARVYHPQVATVHDAGEWKAMQYLVMQLAPGMATVAEHVPLSVTATAAAGAQITAGLSAMHATGLVSGDLKPQNIMVAPDGILKITDFGLVAAPGAPPTQLPAARGHRRTGLQGAKQGGPYSHVGHRADLYSPGCVLHFMLSEKLPFTAPTPAFLVLAHCNSAPPTFTSLHPDIPPELEDLVVRLLAKHLDERPADASVYSLLARHAPSSASDASSDSVVEEGMDVTRPFRFPSSPRRLATRVDDGVRERR